MKENLDNFISTSKIFNKQQEDQERGVQDEDEKHAEFFVCEKDKEMEAGVLPPVESERAQAKEGIRVNENRTFIQKDLEANLKRISTNLNKDELAKESKLQKALQGIQDDETVSTGDVESVACDTEFEEGLISKLTNNKDSKGFKRDELRTKLVNILQFEEEKRLETNLDLIPEDGQVDHGVPTP